MTPAQHSDLMTRRAAEAVRELMAQQGIPPTAREVASALGLRSAAACHVWLERAVERGLLCAGPARASRRFYPVPQEKVG